MRLLRILALACACGSCATSRPVLSDADTLSIVSRDRAPVALRFPGWGEQLRRPLVDKIAVPSDAVLAYIAAENASIGFPNHPRAAAVDDRWRADCVAALAGLPERLQALVNAHLLGIYPVVDLGGSAYTEALSDAQDHVVGGFVAIDVAVLDRTANDWVTWKERSPFREPNTYIEGMIEDAEGDTRANALQYILLHELGHIVSFASGALPKWNTAPAERIAEFPYASLSWRAAGGKLVAKDTEFTARGRVHYYARPQLALPQREAVAVYEGLVRSGASRRSTRRLVSTTTSLTLSRTTCTSCCCESRSGSFCISWARRIGPLRAAGISRAAPRSGGTSTTCWRSK